MDQQTAFKGYYWSLHASLISFMMNVYNSRLLQDLCKLRQAEAKLHNSSQVGVVVVKRVNAQWNVSLPFAEIKSHWNTPTQSVIATCTVFVGYSVQWQRWSKINTVTSCNPLTLDKKTQTPTNNQLLFLQEGKDCSSHDYYSRDRNMTLRWRKWPRRRMLSAHKHFKYTDHLPRNTEETQHSDVTAACEPTASNHAGCCECSLKITFTRTHLLIQRDATLSFYQSTWWRAVQSGHSGMFVTWRWMKGKANLSSGNGRGGS